MARKTKNQEKSGDFRKKAEEKLRQLSLKPLHELSVSDSLNLIHELQVHQVELEMQNEELRDTQSELEDSRSRYSDLYDFAPIGYLTINTNGVIVEANLTAAEHLGIERSFMIKKPFSFFVHKYDKDIFYMHCKRVFEGKIRVSCEARIKRKDNSFFYAQMVSWAVQDKDGNYNMMRTAMINVDERRLAEEALRASEDRHRSYIELTDQLVWTTNADGEVKEDIPSWRKFTGQSKEDIMGWGWSKALHPDDVELTAQVWKKAVASKSKYEIEYRVRRNDGIYRYFLAHGTPVLNKEGHIREWVGTCIDINERKKEGEALKEKQILNERLLNAIPHPAMLINTKRIVQAANKISLDLGVKLGDYCWKEFGKCEYLSEEDKKRAEGNPDEEGIKCSFCLADKAMKGPELIKMNDPEVYAFDRIWDTYWDPIDKHTFLHYAIDITERKKAEEEINKHREHLMELVDERTSELNQINEELKREIAERTRAEKQMKLMALFAELNPSPVLRFDEEGKVLVANPAAVEILDLGTLTGMSLNSLIPGIDGLDLTACINDGVIFSHQAQIGDQFFHFIFRGLPELKIGQVYGSNITKQKMVEAGKIRTSHLISLGELAAGVAHEINNPINGIINYSQILLNKSIKDSKEHDIAIRIIKEGDRIADIVKSLLSFARDRKEKKHSVSIDEIISNALSLTEIQLRNDGIKIRIDIPSDLPDIIAHPQHIQQVFMNVISNSRYALNQKYHGTHEDKVIEIMGEKIMTDDDPYVQIIFFDKGHGIPASIMDKIMNPFFTTKPGEVGTGLGLSISHGIINDHGGRIMVDSVEGKFTKVIIELTQTAKTKGINDERGLK